MVETYLKYCVINFASFSPILYPKRVAKRHRLKNNQANQRPGVFSAGNSSYYHANRHNGYAL